MDVITPPGTTPPPAVVHVFVLDSVGLLPKFSGGLGALLVGLWLLARKRSSARGVVPDTVVLCCLDRSLQRRAMAAHASQLVWFRHLFVAFSRYGYVNTLTRVAC